jgi:hypothetical protein
MADPLVFNWVEVVLSTVLGIGGGWFAGGRVARRQVLLERSYQDVEQIWDELQAAEDGFHEPHGLTSHQMQGRAGGLMAAWHHLRKAGVIARRLPDRYSDLKTLCMPFAGLHPDEDQRHRMYSYRDGVHIHVSPEDWAACLPPEEVRNRLVEAMFLAERRVGER